MTLGMLYISLLSLALMQSCIRANDAGDEFTNQFEIEILDSSGIGEDQVTDVAARYNLQYVEQIVPSVHLYVSHELPEFSSQPTSFPELESFFRSQIEIVQIRLFPLRRQPEPVAAVSYRTGIQNILPITHMNLVCQPYYDMGVEYAWAQNLTGAGVVVGVVDIGVNIELTELHANIDESLSYNFVGKNSNVTPEVGYPLLQKRLDHGNGCAGLIAGVKGNGMCSAGVAPNSKLAALRAFLVFDYSVKYLLPDLAKANFHKADDIHIYSNSWAPKGYFHSVDVFMRAAFSRGISKGRHGKGSIYVFPCGFAGNGYANSIYTIAVGAVGVNGSRLKNTEPSSCTLTSAYGQGSKLSDTHLVTASFYNPPCTSDFDGESAATPLVAGILALALQANPELTWRDIQHIAVKSSRHTDLVLSHDEFRPNGAGLYFHDYFGFGLLRADDVTTNAKKWTPVTRQIVCHNDVTERLHSKSKLKRGTESTHARRRHIGVHCCVREVGCIHHLEHVVVSVTFTARDIRSVRLILESPRHTMSYLVQNAGKPRSNSTRITTELMSVNFWGENPEGTWILKLERRNKTRLEHHAILHVNMTLYGTSMWSPAPSSSPESTSHSSTRSSPDRATDSDTVPDGSNDVTDTRQAVGNLIWTILLIISICGTFIFFILYFFRECIMPLIERYSDLFNDII